MTLTIPAPIVADSIGLPPMWADSLGWAFSAREECDCLAEYAVSLADPQTAFGLALKLDEWERASGDLGACQWAAAYAELLYEQKDVAPFLTGMIARITHIALDHRIRRALGEEPKPGTLAKIGLMQPHRQWWRYDAREHGGAFIEWDLDGQLIGSAECGKLAPIRVDFRPTMTHDEALQAIAAEVCP